MKYEDAVKELEEIASSLETGEIDIDELSDKLKQARKLIKLCKEKLSDAAATVSGILEDEK